MLKICKNFNNYLFLPQIVTTLSPKNIHTSTKYNGKLNPWFVTGFIDGEGCFNIWIAKSKSNLIGWQVQARIIIEVHTKDLDLLKDIQAFFGGKGTITFNRKAARYSMVGINDINNIIIPHFNNYPLQGSKLMNYVLWTKCIDLMLKKEHLTQKGLEQIVSIKSQMNFGGSGLLDSYFPEAKSCFAEKPVLEINNLELDPHWVSGFFAAEGSFFIIIEPQTNKIRPRVSVCLNQIDNDLLIKINNFLNNIGSIYYSPSNNASTLKIGKKDSIKSILDHFDKYPLHGFKLYNYNLWLEMSKIIISEANLSEENINKIKLINSKINKWD